jgi:hypothetical protein
VVVLYQEFVVMLVAMVYQVDKVLGKFGERE